LAKFISDKFRQRASDALGKVLKVVNPVATVVAEATNILVTLQKPSILGVTNAVANGVRSLHGVIDPDTGVAMWAMSTWVTKGVLLDGLARVGGQIGELKNGATPVMVGDLRVLVLENGNVNVAISTNFDAGFEVIRRALDTTMPPIATIYKEAEAGAGLGNSVRLVRPGKLTELMPKGTADVLARTKALLGDHRCILLEGRPGIGKTTMAQAIARDANLGRVVLIENNILASGNGELQFKQLSAGVIVIDDIDKVRVRLETFEAIRMSCRLLIVTANNGSYDDVIDAALARPARIDEIFTVEAPEPFRRAPFDKLDDATWTEVSGWPYAYLNELEKRLAAGVDIRLADLKQRMIRRTRSAAGMMPSEDASEDDRGMVPALSNLMDVLCNDSECADCEPTSHPDID
jgi:ATPase family associated with various cellular activities (AAA)